MGKIADRLLDNKVLVSDGAWGTLLHNKGLKSYSCPESWNLDRPEDVLEVAKSYVDAGADIILTNSFGGSPYKLAPYDLGGKVYEVNRAAAEISRKAAGEDILVLGSIGPTGKMIFMGEVPEEEILDGFRNQAKGLADGGVDGILMETMTDTMESSLAIRATKEVTDLEILCTFTFERTQNGEFRTMMGTSVQEAVQSALDEGADIVGANCGNGTEGMIQIVKEIRALNPAVPILVHANAGLPQYTDGETIFPESPLDMASQVKELIQCGANIVGGCCGTTPEHIQEIKRVVHT